MLEHADAGDLVVQRVASEVAIVAQLDRRARFEACLRDAFAAKYYEIGATGGDIGHVKDFYSDDDAWVIRYLVVDKSRWWIGHKVLIARSWIVDIGWIDATVSIELTRRAVKSALRFARCREPMECGADCRSSEPIGASGSIRASAH